MDKLHYNFVFFFARYDFWRNVLGEELYHNKHVRIYKEAFSGSEVLQRLFHYHWAKKINSKICLPFKFLWFKRMYSQNFEEDLPIVFIYLAGGTVYYGKEFLKYVKKQNPQNRNVMLYEDILKRIGEKEHYLLRDIVDLEVTYDAYEAEKYGMEYFQETTYSKIVSEPDTVSFEYDIYYLGAAKDRLDRIHEAFEYFSQNGLKCKFIVTGVPKYKQIEGIEYSEGITYEQNLQYVIKSKSVLEIIQGGTRDITLRALEAIAYRRKIITDCPLNLKDYFNENQLCQFREVQGIDINFIRRGFNPDDFNPRIDLNPLKRLYFIQEKLDKNV